MTTETTTQNVEPFVRHVEAIFPRRHDLQIHISRIEIEDQVYVDVREFIPSLQQYGRGILIPLRNADEVAGAIAKIAADHE